MPKDEDLNSLLTKLYTLQEDVGAKPKTTDAEKRNRAENATMGKGKKAQKTGTRFMELKTTIIDRLKSIHAMFEQEAEISRGGLGVAQGNNPKDMIARQARIREEIRQADDEWKEIDSIYRAEARKKRSKFSQEELDTQRTLVQKLQDEIIKCKELQSTYYARGKKDDVGVSLNIKALDDSEVAYMGNKGWDAAGAGGGGGAGVELTDQQHLALQQINSRDAEFDKELDVIAEGIKDLSEIAQMQNDEVRMQNVLLDNLGQKIDDVEEHLSNVNSRMKETLDKVRGADKICVDIMCILLMGGLGGVLYTLIKNR
jgi:hypothetical protein